MSVVKSIELVLPKDAIYLAGSSIKGKMILTLNSTLVYPIVKVELVGRGYIEWSEEAGASRDYSRNVICNNKADYVHKTKTFPVEASCMGREHILAKKRMYLLVQGTSTFHKETPLQNPLLVEAEEKVSYNCCRQGTICLQIQMEKNTFTPGEKVVFTTEINNQTSKCIKTGHIRLVCSRSIISTFNLPLLLSVSSSTRDREIMHTRYELVITVHLRWSLTSLKAKVPIIITSTSADSASCQSSEDGVLPAGHVYGLNFLRICDSPGGSPIGHCSPLPL
ncbi:hypothetical protein H8959_019988 [Pygathrix nigripes]